ncbi:hypothetical protein sos41_11500 [Alphaproteobacteria bacterium SO-S41]|nr:hypothetical protein sos41_11500 [Alphaproteobacteria bacterium SO-S41]
MGDEVIYKKGGIEISRTLARFGSTSYPIAGIGSVFISKEKNTAGIILGVAIMLFGAVSLKNLWGFGLLVLGIALAIWASRDHTSRLMLRTASGDQQAFEGTVAQVAEIKAAIEQAVQLRG